ncbi:hypothetical protein BC831DRAFT_440174 [Entophlyctis helioformis]|nr:hypothetical protein BC831DRAFT_440174 [Entophlyctis helioformis]
MSAQDSGSQPTLADVAVSAAGCRGWEWQRVAGWLVHTACITGASAATARQGRPAVRGTPAAERRARQPVAVCD